MFQVVLIDYDISNNVATLSSDIVLDKGLLIVKDYKTNIGEDIFIIENLNNYALHMCMVKLLPGLKHLLI